jgi:hypothetical protein
MGKKRGGGKQNINKDLNDAGAGSRAFIDETNQSRKLG